MFSSQRPIPLALSRAFGAVLPAKSPATSRFSPQYELGAVEPAVSRLPPSLTGLIQSLFKGKLFRNSTAHPVVGGPIGYPRRSLRPAIQYLLATHREACRVKAEYILPHMRPPHRTVPSMDPDELPRTIPEYGDEQCMAYVAWQMPLAFGCVERILMDLCKRIPSFHPQRIFDFGTGPGTAIMYHGQACQKLFPCLD